MSNQTSKMPMIADLRKASQYGGIDLAFAKESLYWKAADEIERLTAALALQVAQEDKNWRRGEDERERLRAALHGVRRSLTDTTSHAAYQALDYVNRALADEAAP